MESRFPNKEKSNRSFLQSIRDVINEKVKITFDTPKSEMDYYRETHFRRNGRYNNEGTRNN
jgi:hypothetical protein